MDKMIYKCVCGREFSGSQALNSHKSQCKEHYLNKYGDLVKYEAQQEARHKAAQESFIRKAELSKLESQANWIAEQHICERCGKIMTEKFGSGRFCSRACANARDHSAETKTKISQALVKPEELKKKRVRSKAEPKIRLHKAKVIDPKDLCLVCGKELKSGHKFQYCHEHLVAHRHEEQISNWLATGETGLNVDSSLGPVFRNYILDQQNGCCAICGMPAVWNNKPLTFILDHIDGNAARSERSNLRLICPNCDSQLDTYKSKNKNSARTKRKNFLRKVREENKLEAY